MIFKLYSAIIGLIFTAGITLAIFAYIATGVNYAPHGFGFAVMCVGSILLPTGWDEENPGFIAIGAATSAGVLVMIAYLATLV